MEHKKDVGVQLYAHPDHKLRQPPKTMSSSDSNSKDKRQETSVYNSDIPIYAFAGDGMTTTHAIKYNKAYCKNIYYK